MAEESEAVLKGRKKGEVISDIEFVYRNIQGRICAITGTNGKSTATALLGKVLETGKRKVFWGGNIAPGKPAGFALTSHKEIFVFEVSSFQLEKIKDFKPNIAILLNITFDHRDRYKCLEDYIAAKANIFKNQGEDDVAILNYDDLFVRGLAKKIAARVFYFSLVKEVVGSYLRRGNIYIKLPGEMPERILSVKDIKIKGKFNWQNVMAVSLAARLLGLEPKEIRRGVKRFSGLPHRLEFVRRLRGVDYINNSMCTNPDAFAKTLASFEKPVVLIAGGKNKGFSLSEYVKPIEEHSRWTILIGEVREELFRELSKDWQKKTYCADSLRSAVFKAVEVAKRNDIVLFSPGFASFDMFRDFQERGREFKRIVCGLR